MKHLLIALFAVAVMGQSVFPPSATSVSPAAVTGARICTISSSSATAYVGATSPAMSTYPAGVEVRFTANQTSGAAPTLNCGGGAMAIRDALASAAIPTGFMESGYVYTVRSNGTYWLMQEPAPGAAGQKFLSTVSVGATVQLNPACDGTTDVTSVIQAALTAYKHVRIVKAGNCIISSTLQLQTGNHLELSQGTVIKLKAHSNTLMFTNADYTGGNPGITIEGGTWDGNYLNQDNGAWSGNLSVLDNTPYLRLIHTNCINSFKYCFTIANSNDFLVQDIYFNTPSDGVHLWGPSARFAVKDIRGYTGDNMVALTIGDYESHPATHFGNMSDGLIENVRQNGGHAPVVLVGEPGYEFRRISIHNIGGLVGAGGGPMVSIIDDGSTLTGVGMYDIDIQDISGTVEAAQAMIYINASNFHEGFFKNITATGNVYGVQIAAGTTINRLLIDGIRNYGAFSQPLVSIAGTVSALQINNAQTVNTSVPGQLGVVQVEATGVVTSLGTSNSSAKWPGAAGQLIRVVAGGSVTSWRGESLFQSGGYAMAYIQGTIAQLTLANTNFQAIGTDGYTVVFGGSGVATQMTINGAVQVNGDAFIYPSSASSAQSYLNASDVYVKGVATALINISSGLISSMQNVTMENVPALLHCYNNNGGTALLGMGGYRRIGTGTSIKVVDAGTADVFFTATTGTGLGVGTASPQQPLHVVGNTPVRLERTGAGYFDWGITAALAGSSADLKFTGSVAGGYMFMTNSGNDQGMTLTNGGVLTVLGLVDASGKGVKLPTTCTGLAAGTLYNNAGTPAICP